MLIAFCLLFLIFYHVNPEYHLFALPMLVLIPFMSVFRYKKALFVILQLIWGFCAWGYGVFFGIRIFLEGISSYSRSKEIIANIYKNYLGFLPVKLMEITMLAITLISITAILILSITALNSLNKKTVT